MRLVALLAGLFLLAPAARADYLNTPGEIARAWALLAPRVPAGAEVLALQASPENVVLEWRGDPARGGIAAIILRSGVGEPKPHERVEGPGWAPDRPDPALVPFGAADLAPLAGFDALLARARAAVKLGGEARAVRVVAQTPPEDLGLGAFAFGIHLETETQVASVQLDLTGRVLWLAVEARADLPRPVPAAAAVPAPEPPPPAPSAPFRGDGGADLVAGLAAFAARLGPDTRIREVDARPDRITIDRPHPANPGTTAILTLTERGFREARTFPRMMQTDAGLFPLAALAGLTPEAVEAARAAGLAAVALPGGEPERLRIWSGAPFWRHPQGQPFFDIRVGVPPQGNRNGYAVVTLGGQVVEAFR